LLIEKRCRLLDAAKKFIAECYPALNAACRKYCMGTEKDLGFPKTSCILTVARGFYYLLKNSNCSSCEFLLPVLSLLLRFGRCEDVGVQYLENEIQVPLTLPLVAYRYVSSENAL